MPPVDTLGSRFRHTNNRSSIMMMEDEEFDEDMELKMGNLYFTTTQQRRAVLFRKDHSEISSRGRRKRRSRCLYAVAVVALLVTLVVAVVKKKTSSSNSHPENPYNNSTDPSVTGPEITTLTVLGQDYTFDDIAYQQIQNYKQGTALMVDIQLLHQGSSVFCRVMGQTPRVAQPAPSTDCRVDPTSLDPLGLDKDTALQLTRSSSYPWTRTETPRNIPLLRAHWHMIAWDYNYNTHPALPLQDTAWDDPNLVSIVILRDPMARLLAKDDTVQALYPAVFSSSNITSATPFDWMDYAQSNYTNNFQLSVLTQDACCQGAATDDWAVESAKMLLSRMTFVLDMECLVEGMQVMAEILGIELDDNLVQKLVDVSESQRVIPYPQVRDFLLRRNKRDLELYAWGKTISLVKCNRNGNSDTATSSNGEQTTPTTSGDGDATTTMTPSPTATTSDGGTLRPVTNITGGDGGLSTIITASQNVSLVSTPSVAPVQQLNQEQQQRTDVVVRDDVQVMNNGQVAYSFSVQGYMQVRAFQSGNGLILLNNILGQDGNAMCDLIGGAPGTKGSPSGSCVSVQAKDSVTVRNFPRVYPWASAETAANVDLVRLYFHFIMWNFNRPLSIPLSYTDWEIPSLVSMVVVKHPMDRLVNGDAWVIRDFPGVGNGTATKDVWWGYAKSKYTNNFALSILAGDGCCNGTNTEQHHLDVAKSLISRMTFVLDDACLTQSIEAVANILEFELNPNRLKLEKQALQTKRSIANNPIPYADVYDYLIQRNQKDIELYQWAKAISVVDCSLVQ